VVSKKGKKVWGGKKKEKQRRLPLFGGRVVCDIEIPKTQASQYVRGSPVRPEKVTEKREEDHTNEKMVTGKLPPSTTRKNSTITSRGRTRANGKKKREGEKKGFAGKGVTMFLGGGGGVIKKKNILKIKGFCGRGGKRRNPGPGCRPGGKF